MWPLQLLLTPALASVVISPRQIVYNFNTSPLTRGLPFPSLLMADMISQLQGSLDSRGETYASPYGNEFLLIHGEKTGGKLVFDQDDRLNAVDARNLICEELRVLSNGVENHPFYDLKLKECSEWQKISETALPTRHYLRILWDKIISLHMQATLSEADAVMLSHICLREDFNELITKYLNDPIPLTTIRLLGAGGFGEVSLCSTEAGKIVAVKRLKVDGKRFAQHGIEIEAMRRVQGDPRFAKLFGAQLASFSSHVEVIMEYLDGVTGTSLMQLVGKIEDLGILSAITRQVLLGISTLNQKGLRHDDLKGDNMFFTRQGEVKIIDLGSTARLTSPCRVIGVAGMAAPEHFDGKLAFGPSSDLWNVAVVLFYAHTQQLLDIPSPKEYFEDAENLFKTAIEKALGPLPENDAMQIYFKDFLSRILKYLPEERPSIDFLLKHPFITNGASETELQSWIKNNLAPEKRKRSEDQLPPAKRQKIATSPIVHKD